MRASDAVELVDFGAQDALPLGKEGLDFGGFLRRRIGAAIQALDHQLKGQVGGLDTRQAAGGGARPAWMGRGWNGHGKLG